MVKKEMAEQPYITIAMPVWNKAYCIQEVLDSIAAQDYRKNKINLVFVDNVSQDGTLEILKRFVDDYVSDYKEIDLLSCKSNVSQARNICLNYVKSEYILWWDSDVVGPDNLCILKAVHFLQENPEYVGIGYQSSTKKPDWYQKAVQVKGTDCGLTWTLMRACVFDRVGNFNVSSPSIEDSELFLRIRKAGMKVFSDSKTTFRHLKPEGFKSTYLDYLKFNYRLGQTEFNHLIKISRFQILKVIYYFCLPIVLLLIFIHWLFPTLYLAPFLLFQIYKAKKNRLYGLLNFFAYIIAGVTLSYSYIISSLKRRMKK